MFQLDFLISHVDGDQFVDGQFDEFLGTPRANTSAP
jgi:hypothetical protein